MVDKNASPRAKLEADAAKSGVFALEEAIFMSAKTASSLGDTATARSMADKYLKNFPDGRFVGEANRLK